MVGASSLFSFSVFSFFCARYSYCFLYTEFNVLPSMSFHSIHPLADFPKQKSAAVHNIFISSFYIKPQHKKYKGRKGFGC